MKRECSRNYTVLHALLVVIVLFFDWVIFFPANMSPDSLWQYEQALNQNYSDFHPPIMSLILTFVMRLGGGIGILMLLQCLLGGFGVYYLARCILEQSGIEKRTASWFALSTFVILISPISPLAVYLMTFWKDAWCAIFFLYFFLIAIVLYSKARNLSLPLFGCLYSVFILVAIAILLTRHNAVAILPSCIAVSWVILYYGRRVSLLTACLISLILVFAYIGAQRSQYILFPIHKSHPETMIMTTDLVGILLEKPRLRDQFPYTSQNLTDDYATVYEYGMTKLSFDYSQAMINEYKKAIEKFPFVWLNVKFRAFYELMKNCDRPTYYWSYVTNGKIGHAYLVSAIGIVGNQFGLKQNTVFHSFRTGYKAALDYVEENAVLRSFSNFHLIWIALDLCGVFYTFFLYLKYRENYFIFWMLLLSTLLSYYSSYIVATAGWDFRYMYPSTLSLQVITLSFVFATIYKFRRRSNSLEHIVFENC